MQVSRGDNFNGCALPLHLPGLLGANTHVLNQHLFHHTPAFQFVKSSELRERDHACINPLSKQLKVLLQVLLDR